MLKMNKLVQICFKKLSLNMVFTMLIANKIRDNPSETKDSGTTNN